MGEPPTPSRRPILMPLTLSPRPKTDDVTTVRRFFEAWTADDLQAMLALVDPRVVVEPLLGVLYEREIYRGRVGIIDAVRELGARWDRFEIRVENALPA